MSETAESEKTSVDVKFYPIRNRHLERSVVGVSRLLKIILFLCAIIAVLVMADFLGYAYDDVKNFITGEKGQTVIADTEQNLDKTIGKLSLPSMFAGHSYSADSVGQMHTRSTLQKMLTSQTPDSQSARSGYYGVDVSHWQHNIQWNDLATDSIPQQVDFSIIKATQGASWVDPSFAENWKQSNSVLQMSGAYHYYIFSDDPQSQANNFIKNVPLTRGNLPPIVDVELDCSSCDSLHITQEKINEDLALFFKELEDHFKVKPIIYSNTDFYKEYLASAFQEYTFWMAEYEKTPPQGLIGLSFQPADSGSAPAIAIWQFTDYDRLKGIVGRVDMNFMPEQARNVIDFITD